MAIYRRLTNHTIFTRKIIEGSRLWWCVSGRRSVTPRSRFSWANGQRILGRWNVAQKASQIDHQFTVNYLGILRKGERGRTMSKKLFKQCDIEKRYVSAKLTRSFCGRCVSLTMAMSCKGCYTHSMFDSLSMVRWENRIGVRLNRQPIRALRFWRKLSKNYTRRAIFLFRRQASVNTDSVDNCCCGPLYFYNISVGAPALYVDKEIWTWKERAMYISHRELLSVHLLSESSIGKRLDDPVIENRVVKNDNSAIVHFRNSFLSANTM